MDSDRLEARVEALEWVIQAAITAALGPLDRQQQRRGELVEAILSAKSINQEPVTGGVAQDSPHLLSVNDTAEALGVYELIRSGELPSIQIGRRRLVPRHLMVDWITERAERSPDS